MERDDNWYRMIYDYDASTLDNYTQGLMLKAAATPFPQNGEKYYTANYESIYAE